MRLVVLSDTHIPDFARELPAALIPALRRAELILHAGDVTTSGVLDELSGYAPVHAAMGNRDGPDVALWGARDEGLIEVEGFRLALLHDAGPAAGRGRRMRRRFPDADLVVFGHSHIPIDLAGDDIRLFNPGSATWKAGSPPPRSAPW